LPCCEKDVFTLPPQTDKRRLSSRAVKIGAVGVLSLAMVGCGSDEETMAHCVDRSQLVVDDDNCDEDDLDDGSDSYDTYFWYYGGRRGGDGRASGGSLVPPSDGKITTASGKTVSRGGFGGSGSSGG
jgi:hypothetical protein